MFIKHHNTGIILVINKNLPINLTCPSIQQFSYFFVLLSKFIRIGMLFRKQEARNALDSCLQQYKENDNYRAVHLGPQCFSKGRKNRQPIALMETVNSSSTINSHFILKFNPRCYRIVVEKWGQLFRKQKIIMTSTVQIWPDTFQLSIPKLPNFPYAVLNIQPSYASEISVYYELNVNP